MSRFVKLSLVVALAAPCSAVAQGRALQARAAGWPTGMSVPTGGAAAAEEPTALEANPAGTGFVDGLTLQYFHEGGSRNGQASDGAWLTSPIGPFVPTFAMQWIRPGDGGGPRFRKTSVGLAIADLRSFSLAGTVNWF